MKKPPELKPVNNFLRAANLYPIVSWLILNSGFSVSAVPPEIVHPPRGQEVILYQQAAFGVIATGTAPLSYQWRKDGQPIPGATNDQTVIAQSRFSDAGAYSVAVSNAEGSVSSAGAILAVNAPKGGDVDCSFVWGGSINGPVSSIIVQSDGKILIGGTFTTVHRAARCGIARLHPDGTTDHTFLNGLPGLYSPLGAHNTDVNAVVLQNDGKVLIAGSFTTVNGLQRNGIARLNRDGSLDTSFEVAEAKVARLNRDGSLATDFEVAEANNGRIRSIGLQRDGKVVIGGNFINADGAWRNGFFRVNPDGTLDKAFLKGLKGAMDVQHIAIQNNGNILIAGDFGLVINGVNRLSVARLKSDGGLDDGFAPARFTRDATEIWNLEAQPDGKVLIVGSFSGTIDPGRVGLLRLAENGALDMSFQPELSTAWARASAITVQPDGKLLVACASVAPESHPTTVIRLNSDGSLDRTFRGSVLKDWGIRALALQSDGKVLVGGEVSPLKGEQRNSLVRLNSDGTLDSHFQMEISEHSVPVPKHNSTLANIILPEVHGIENAMLLTVQADGKMLIRGDGILVARLNPDRTLDPQFESFRVGNFDNVPWLTPGLSSIVLQDDGKILIAGGNLPPLRLNPNGTVDRDFSWSAYEIPCGGSAPIYLLAAHTNGAILVATSCGDCDSGPRPILRLRRDGILDSSFRAEVSGCGSGIDSITVQHDGKILIGGSFSVVNGVGRSGIARLNTDGTLDESFHNGLPGTGGLWGISVHSITLQPEGEILIGGNFSVVNGIPAAGVARLWASPHIPPRITSLAPGATGVNLNWDALPGRTYRVQYKDDLAAPWTDLAGNVSGSLTGAASEIDRTVGKVRQRFYRVELSP